MTKQEYIKALIDLRDIAAQIFNDKSFDAASRLKAAERYEVLQGVVNLATQLQVDKDPTE